jgi:hypothetical protein
MKISLMKMKKMTQMNAVKNAAAIMVIIRGVIIQMKQMTYRIAIWRLCFCRTLLLARAPAKASSCNGFGCGLNVRPLQVLVRMWTVLCAGMARGAAGLRPSAGRAISVGLRRNCIQRFAAWRSVFGLPKCSSYQKTK